MARYVTIAAVYGTAPNFPSGRQLPTGTTLASDAASQLPGDFIFPAFTTLPQRANVLPLDAAAAAIMGIPIVTLAQLVSQNLCIGGASIGMGQ